MRQILTSQLGVLRNRGFSVKSITCDPAGELQALAQEGVDGVAVKIVGPKTHVKVAERAIRTITERVRTLKYSLPWSLPRNLLKYAVYYAVVRINQLGRRSVHFSLQTASRKKNKFYKRGQRRLR